MSANLSTILISGFSSLLGGAVVLAGVFIAWGQLKEQVKRHGICLDSGKSKLEKQEKIEAKVETIEKFLERDEKDHIEIFGRLHSLEIGMAALPGQMAQMIDERFERFRENIKTDVKSVIYEVKNEK